VTYILVIWTIVGYAGTSSTTWKEYDWRPIGDFKNAAACEHAAKHLGQAPRSFRCLPTGTK
jgi:hypothetical protein